MLQTLVLIIAAATLAVPPLILVTSGTATISATSTAIRLTGLLAFTLIFWNIMTGALSRRFYDLFRAKRVMAFHRVTGMLGFLLALAHGVMIITYGYLPGYSRIWIIGPIAIALLAVTILAALNRRRLSRVWRNIHRINYAVFLLIYIKAVIIGTDLVSPGGSSFALKVVFSAYLGTVVIALLFRASEAWKKKATHDSAPTTY